MTISALTFKSPDKDTLQNSLRHSGEAYKFIDFKDKLIHDLMVYYDKAKNMKNKTPEVNKIIDRIENNLKRLISISAV